jgi:hypothetical protein
MSISAPCRSLTTAGVPVTVFLSPLVEQDHCAHLLRQQHLAIGQEGHGPGRIEGADRLHREGCATRRRLRIARRRGAGAGEKGGGNEGGETERADVHGVVSPEGICRSCRDIAIPGGAWRGKRAAGNETDLARRQRRSHLSAGQCLFEEVRPMPDFRLAVSARGGELALSHNLFLRAAFRYSDYGRVARGQKAAGMIDWRF